MSEPLRPSHSSPNVTELFRAAARELLPVILDLGPEQARFDSFVSAICEDGGEHVVLEPVSDALPDLASRPIRISPQGGGDWYVIAHAIERAGPGRARVPLASAQVFAADPSPATVPVSPTEVLVMVVPGGLHGSAAHVFPVQRIGAESCEIRSNVPLPAGQRLDCVELIGDRRLLRRAGAQVVETLPCYLPDGGKSFTCRLSLSDELPADRERLHDLVTDAAEVRRLFELAGLLRLDGWYEAPGVGRGRLRFGEVGASDAHFELASSHHGEPPPAQAVRIGFNLFAVGYEADVRVLELTGPRLLTSLPLLLRRKRRHRREDRVRVPPGDPLQLSFRNPVTGAIQTHDVAELSFFSVAFDCPATGTVLWRSLPLEQAQLTWRGRLLHLGDLAVERFGLDANAGRMRCVAAITQSRVTDDPDMICLLATLAHPQVRSDDGSNFAGLHRTYLRAGLFGPHMERNLAPIFDETAHVWHRLHTRASDVVRTFVHGPESAPDAAVTIMRAWEHGWMVQHFVDVSTEVPGATGKLQHAYLDHLFPRPDGRYLVFFVKVDNHVMNAYLRRFFASTGTADAIKRSVVELWSRRADAEVGRPDALPGAAVRECRRGDEVVVSRAAQRRLGSYGACALSMIPGELDLPDTRDRFVAAELTRERDCRLVTTGDDVAYALLEERSTPGINLTWMLNATWIVPVHPELDRDHAALDTALRAVVERPAQSATGERFLNLPQGIAPEPLAAWGFIKEAAVYLYVLNRADLHRLFQYASARYGELGARALLRERRRGGGSGSRTPSRD